jgi:MotA/TolQ/ExbB proton channel family
MDKVMGGIAEALIATAVGLFVAIPAVVAYNFFQKKIADVEDNLASINKRLCALLGTLGSFGEPPEAPPASPESTESPESPEDERGLGAVQQFGADAGAEE